MDALGQLDLRGRKGSMALGASTASPSTPLIKNVVAILANLLMEANDAALNKTIIQALKRLGLENHTALCLLDWVEERVKTTRVAPAFAALEELGIHTKELASRLVGFLRDLSPAGLRDVRTGEVQPSCMEAALSLLRSFPEAAFSNKVSLEGGRGWGERKLGIPSVEPSHNTNNHFRNENKHRWWSSSRTFCATRARSRPGTTPRPSARACGWWR